MYHIAQINIAELKGLKGDPIVAEFYAALDAINAVADRAPGFVWRLQTEEGDATSLRVFDADTWLINMSVWESIEALYQYTYYSEHASVYRRRAEWTNKLPTMHMALWYIPAGTTPALEDGKSALDRINAVGPTPLAFTFRQRYTTQQYLEFLALNKAAADKR
jgi:hypothetical protein